MKFLTVKAPCKINLALDIRGLLPNGYHEMDMVMQTVGLCDTLTIGLRDEEGVVMTCSDESLPCDESNICVRCAKAFFAAIGQIPKARIHLEKKIPMMAGLGGGSADGAAVLVGAAAALIWYAAMSRRQFGGITGDLAGWFVQVCELLTVAAVVLLQKGMGVLG